MKLRDLFRKLALMELNNLSMATGDVISSTAYPRVIQATNDALRDMFSRMLLSEKTLLVQSLDWKANYPLRKEHAFTDPSSAIKYIVDTPAYPFTGDLVKILGVTNEVGDTLPMNDTEQWASVFTPQFDTVQLTHVGDSQVFSVSYQALHAELLETVADPVALLDQDVIIPSILEDMLRIKVAHGIFSAMSGQEYSLKAQVLEATYEMKYTAVDQNNLVGDAGLSTNVKLHLRGFP